MYLRFLLCFHFGLFLKTSLPEHLTLETRAKPGTSKLSLLEKDAAFLLPWPHCTASGVLFQPSEISQRLNLNIWKLFTQVPRGVLMGS